MNTEKPRKTALTDDIIEKLRAERERTSTGPKSLLKPYTELPKGLNHPMVTHWLGGRIKTARTDHLDFIVSAWERLESIETVEMTDKLFAELTALQKQSGINSEMVMRWSRETPDGMTVSKIKHYLSGKAKIVRSDHVEFLQRVWSKEA